MQEDLKIRLNGGSPVTDKYEVHIFRKFSTGYSVVTEIIMEDIEDGKAVDPLPALFLSPTALQELANELYQLGFKPKDAIDNTGKVEALQAHLKDMRDLLFFFIRNSVGQPATTPPPIESVEEEEKPDDE